MMRVSALVLGLAAVMPAAAQAQRPQWAPVLRGYFLNVPIASAAGPFSDAVAADVQRLRLMARSSYGPLSVDVAYEHVLTLRSEATVGLFAGLSPTGTGGDWLPLQGSLLQKDHIDWQHRVDRASLAYGVGSAEATIGRQPISWATTLFLTPADPFVPFDPSDPFREYRRGVDAVRLRGFPGAFSEIDLAFRVANTPIGRTVSAAGRGRAAVGAWEFLGWAGVVHDDPAVSVAATLSIGGAVLRTESVVRRANDETVFRATIGADRSFVVWDRNVYVVLEYQRDGFGAASGDDLIATLLSEPARRGELQVFGRDEVVVQGSLELHPLVNVSALVIWNVNDPSALLGPAASYSAADEVAVRGGVYFGAGRGTTASGLLGSEFGAVPTTAYASVTWFF
ncbi:MAG: hypothetical protein OER90_07790 [Gemmatimonadota bacterium]|nr:hypothetical protein [Gemmatimonadota bacterium]